MCSCWRSPPNSMPRFERLYAYVQDDVTRRYATPQLAMTLFASGEDAPDMRDCFLADAPLRRLGLMEHDDAHPTPGFASRPLRIDERVLDFLLGVNHLDQRLAAFLRTGAGRADRFDRSRARRPHRDLGAVNPCPAGLARGQSGRRDRGEIRSIRPARSATPSASRYFSSTSRICRRPRPNGANC